METKVILSKGQVKVHIPLDLVAKYNLVKGDSIVWIEKNGKLSGVIKKKDEFKTFVCSGCQDVVPKKEELSPTKNLCIACYREAQAVEKNQCLKCGGPAPHLVYWGMCHKCIDERRNKNNALNSKKKYKPKMEDFK